MLITPMTDGARPGRLSVPFGMPTDGYGMVIIIILNLKQLKSN